MRIQPRRRAASHRDERPAPGPARARRLRHRRWLAALAVGLFALQMTGVGPVSAAPGDPAAPGASLSPTSHDFGEQAVDTTTGPQQFALTNTGTEPLAIGATSIGGSNAGDFAIIDDLCNGAAIAPEATCTISATFTPTTAGARSATLVITDTFFATHTAALTGTGIPDVPGASLTPTSHDFGEQTVDTTTGPQQFTLTNTGTAPLGIGIVAINGADLNDFAGAGDNTCSAATVAPGSTCTISLTFTPRSAGPRSATLSISDNAPGSPHTAALTGTGVAAVPVASLTPTSHDYGDQQVGTTSNAAGFTLTNTGTGPLVIGDHTVDGPNPGDVVVVRGAGADTCSESTVAPGDTCTLILAFSPGGTGPRSATLSINDNAADSPQTITLTGTGIGPPAPEVSITPTSHDYGDQQVGTTSGPQQFTVTNTGTAPLVIGNVPIDGPDADDFAGAFVGANTCSASIVAPRGTCSLTLTFTPKAAGSRSAALSINDNATGSPHTVALTGTGLVPAPGASIAPADHNFGRRTVGTTSGPQRFTLTNTGTAPLVIDTIEIRGDNPGDYAITDDHCSAVTVVPGDACTIAVTFAPTAAGPRFAALIITDNAAGLYSAALTGAGATAHATPTTTPSSTPSRTPAPSTTPPTGSSPPPPAQPSGGGQNSGGLAFTGSPIRLLTTGALALLAAGACLTAAATVRRRRDTTPPSG